MVLTRTSVFFFTAVLALSVAMPCGADDANLWFVDLGTPFWFPFGVGTLSNNDTMVVGWGGQWNRLNVAGQITDGGNSPFDYEVGISPNGLTLYGPSPNRGTWTYSPDLNTGQFAPLPFRPLGASYDAGVVVGNLQNEYGDPIGARALVNGQTVNLSGGGYVAQCVSSNGLTLAGYSATHHPVTWHPDGSLQFMAPFAADTTGGGGPSRDGAFR